MRQKVQISPTRSLKGIQSEIGELPIRSGTVLQLSQHNSTVYTIYEPQANTPSNICKLPFQLCQYNKLQPSVASIEPVTQIPPMCKYAKIYVKRLDWQIINNKSHILEEEFLNQISLIWPNALIPLYYDENNCVCLRVECEQLSFIKENAELEILVCDSQSSEEQSQAFETIIQVSNLHNHQLREFGNINSVVIPEVPESEKWQYQLEFAEKVRSEQVFPTHTYDLSIQQQLEYLKKRDGTNEKTQKQDKIRRYPIIPESAQEKVNSQSLSLSYALSQYWKIDEQADIKIRYTQKAEGTNKKLSFLLDSMKDLSIVIEVLVRNEQDYCREQLQLDFSRELCASLQAYGEIRIYQKIPFMICGVPHFINLFEGDQRMQDPLTIVHGLDTVPHEHKQKLRECVSVSNLYYEHQADPEQKLKIQALIDFEGKPASKVNAESSFKQMYRINYESEIQEIKQAIQSSKMTLVSSFANNGKTILNQILAEEGYKTLYIDMAQMDDTGLTMGDVTLFLQTIFQQWCDQYIFFDNIDAVCYKIDASDLHRKQQRIASKIIARTLINCSKVYDRSCILTCKNEGNLDEEFKGYQHINLKNPSLQQRMDVLTQTTELPIDRVEQIANTSESMSFGQFVKYAQTGVKRATRDVAKPEFNFHKLAGLMPAKKTIKSVIERPLKYSFIFKRLPIKLSRGVLLYGGSGIGKTSLGEALADEFCMKVFRVKGSDVLSKYIGGSEAAVREIFEKAMSVSPSIIFFDQFETMVPRRNSSNSGVTDRVVNQFLCYLDGVASTEGVFIVAASSRPDLIDPALLRPGRIDTHIYLKYPTLEERKQLLNLFSNSIHFQSETDEILRATQHFSYSDMVGLIKQLRIKKSAEILKSTNLIDSVHSSEFKTISQQLFSATLRNYRISVNKQQQSEQQTFFDAFRNGGIPDISKQKTTLK